MSKETKFGYGFLLAGVGLPYLIERLFGQSAALIVAAVLLIAGICLLIAGHLHEHSGLAGKIISILLAIIMLIGGIMWRVHRSRPEGTSVKVGQTATTDHQQRAATIPSPRPHAPLATAVPRGPRAKEEALAQKREFLSRLTKLYIASHDGVSSEMMAGLQLPPDDWLNEQLNKYRKDWRVKNGKIVPAAAMPPPSPSSVFDSTVAEWRLENQPESVELHDLFLTDFKSVQQKAYGAIFVDDARRISVQCV